MRTLRVASYNIHKGFAVTPLLHRRLTIHDLQGRRVRVIEAAGLGPGTHQLFWDRRDGAGARAPAGLYLAMVETASGRLTTRCVVVD